MDYTPYAREMMELMKQLTSGSIKPDEYKKKRAEIEKKYKSEHHEFKDDNEMISYLEQLACKSNPNMVEPDEIINSKTEKPQRRRKVCQTNTSS